MHLFRGIPGYYILTACILASAASLPFLGTPPSSRFDLVFVTEMTSDRTGAAQLFWDIGRGFNEADSASTTLVPTSTPTTRRFPFPSDGLRKLRFDPINIDASVSFQGARIESAEGRVLRRLEPAELVAVQHVADLQQSKDGITFAVPPGQGDPIFNIDVDGSLRFRISSLGEVTKHVVRWLIFFAGLIGLGWLAQRLVPWIRDRGVSWIQARPVLALALISACSVIIQCHPVIFFGKSFVSPDNACYLLYDGFPTLPGYHSDTLEESKGSDTAAVLLAHLNFPKIAHDSILRDGELPLWNRYTICGVPSLGQGQSMFGELLSLPSVLFQSEAWTWDVRFVLSRWLYAFGVALAVWLLTRRLLSATLIAGTAAYIGFFAFRLNHPAQFSLCAAPWILIAWLWLRDAQRPRHLALALAALMLANWEVHASGTVKEAIVLMACVNLAGFLVVLLDAASWRMRFIRLGSAVFAGVVYVLLTAPVWVTFLDALRQSHTNYDTPIVSQVGPWGLAGFFEDLGYRSHRVEEPHVLPSANVVVMIGMLWAAVRYRQLLDHRGARALALAALVPWAMAFAVVPAEWIKNTPFLANIHHIDNSFSCALIVLGTVLAGYGLGALADAIRDRDWPKECLLFAAYVGVLIALMYGSVQWAPYSGFVKVYVPSLVLAVVAVHVALAGWRRKPDLALLAVALAAAAVVLLWRHGTYIRTPFDPYVFNPKVRASFHAPSPGVQFVTERMAEPSRPTGLRYNLFGGFNTMFGWESIYGVDALRSPWCEELYKAIPLRKFFWGQGMADWSTWLEEDTKTLQPFLDALNVRYYLASPGTPADRMGGLNYLTSLDFEIYESPSAWPRAFFSSHVETYEGADDLVQRLKSTEDRRPRAAIAAADLGMVNPPEDIVSAAADPGRVVIAATDYRLTTNTTSFAVQASGPGVVVLTENFVPEDFRAYVNGERVPYFRINHAFKGVFVDAAGEYTIRYEYWPRHMTASLWVAAIGALFGIGAFAWAWGRDKPVRAAAAAETA